MIATTRRWEASITPGQELRRGWPVIGAAFCGVATGVVSVPAQLIGPQMGALRTEFGWSDGAVALAGTCMGVGLAIGSPIAGRLLDRVGARPLAFASMTLLAVMLVSLAAIGPDIVWFYSAYFLAGLLCAGSGITTYTRALGSWFDKARGLALGIALSGTGAAVFVAPIFANAVGERYGWRAVYLAASAIVVLALPVVAAGLRERGTPVPPADAPHGGDAPRHLWRRTIRDRRFVLLAVSLVLFGIVLGGTTIRFVPMLIDGGYSRASAARMASMLGVALIVGRLLMGSLVDRLPAAYLAACTFGLAALGCSAFVIAGPSVAILPIVLIGFVWGAEYDIISYLVMKFFGVENYGSIFGALFSVYLIVGLASIPFTNLILQHAGYPTLLLVNAACYAGVAITLTALGLVTRPGKTLPA